MAITADAWYYFFLLLISFVFTLLVRPIINKLRNSKPKFQHPPAPPALPIIGHLHLLSSNLPKSLHKLSSRYGPIMRIRLGVSNLLVVSNASVAQEVLKAHDLNFSFKPDFGASDYDLYQGSSFFAAEYGPYWRFMKRICMTELLSASQLSRFTDIRREELKKLLETLAKRSDEGEACDMGVELMTMTNNVICRMGMSTRCSENAGKSSEVRKLSKELAELAAKLSMGEVLGPLMKRFDLFGHGRKLKDVYRRFDTIMEGIMMEHEKEKNGNRRKDMMDILLEIYYDQTAEVRLTRNGIKAFLLDIFLGGTDTTSIAVQWTLAELINHPNVFKKLRDEIRTVVGPCRLVDESDIANLPYLQAVVKESLRLHPPVPLILRKCRDDCKINGYDILANTRTFVNAYAIMRDPGLWNDPTMFVPERFLDQQIDTRGLSFHFLPFGSGRRACPGAALALAVTHVTVAALLQCFNWKVQGGGEKVDMQEGSGFSQGMAHPLVCYPITHVNPMDITTTD